MNNLYLYKEFYFREIDRKESLSNAVNTPILVITAIISIHFYLFSQKLNIDILYIGKILSAINLISILGTLFFLIKSYSNFFMAHTYRELSDMASYRKYETDLDSEQKNLAKAKLIFEEHLITEFSECAKHNFNVNKNRTEDIANSKKFLFITVLLTIAFSVIYIGSII